MTRRPHGALERSVLNALWCADGPMSVQDVLVTLDGDLAYTSVATVLNRLADKGAAARYRFGRSFRYSAALSADEHSAQAIRRVISEASNPRAAISGFVNSLSPDEIDLLRSLIETHVDE